MPSEVVRVTGIAGIRKALAPLLEPEFTAQLDKSNKAAAQQLAKRLRPAVGAHSKRMSRAVRVHRAKTGKPGWIVGSRRKAAFFWPFIIGGTRAHAIRTPAQKRTGAAKSAGFIHVRGIEASDTVERVAQAYEAEAFNTAEQSFVQGTGL